MTLKINKLKCERLENPLGIDTLKPRFSWILQSDRRNTIQTAYHIQVALTEEGLNERSEFVWDSGQVESDASIEVVYEGKKLMSFQRYYWKVKVWSNHGEITDWSKTAWWEMGILNASEWKSEWITPDLVEKEEDNPCPMLRKEFTLIKKIKSARVYITSLGLYEFYINGTRVGDVLFTPGFTSFHKNLQYQIYDVSNYLKEGPNAVGVILGDGWYRGHMWIKSIPNIFGKNLALLVQICVTHEDGSREIIVTDESWQCTTGPILCSDLYYGEIYDARLEIAGWSEPNCSFKDWKNVKKYDYGKEHLVCSPCGSGKIMEKIRPKEIITTPNGEVVVDLGQVISGNIRLRVKGEEGTKIILSYTEELDREGNFVIDQYDNLGYQRKKQRFFQIDKYVLKGGSEIIEPHFTFHGFRYVKVEGYPGVLTLDKIIGLVIYSDIPINGDFSCSNHLLNQLHHNIIWSQKGNFLEVPSDCPQREKMGWTGDIQIYVATACFLMESSGFLVKWLRDLRADQFENGLVPHIIPWLPDYPVYGPLGIGGSSGWGDACINVPWMLYLYYGDKRILEEMYEVMKKWLDFIQSRSKNYIWKKGMHWGDWLEPGKKEYKYFLPWDKKAYIATPFSANSSYILSKIAKILGREVDEKKYEELSKRIKAAYLTKFIKKDGRSKPSRQGAYVIALAFDMVPKELRPKLTNHLKKLIIEKDYHLATGFLSTPHLCQVLCDNGCEEIAFKLLNQDTIPSWLYEVKKGATTIWEAWDCIKPDGSLYRGESFNHYAFGSIGEWLYRYIAGIGSDERQPAFKNVILSPHPGGGLNEAKFIHQTPYGELKSEWKISEGNMVYNVSIPVNCTAAIHLPGAQGKEVKETGQNLENVESISEIETVDRNVIMRAGSGVYKFSYPYSK